MPVPAILDAPTIVGSNSQDSARTFLGSGESARTVGKSLSSRLPVKPAIERAFFCCGQAICAYQMPVIY